MTHLWLFRPTAAPEVEEMSRIHQGRELAKLARQEKLAASERLAQRTLVSQPVLVSCGWSQTLVEDQKLPVEHL